LLLNKAGGTWGNKLSWKGGKQSETTLQTEEMSTSILRKRKVHADDVTFALQYRELMMIIPCMMIESINVHVG